MCVINKFNKYIFLKYDLQMTECLTISRLALNIFITHYLGESKLALINKVSIFNFIKEGYFGGITEVYIPYCENGFYYDVNSEYPFVAKNPMPGNKCNYMEDFSGSGLNLDELFGYFYCRIKTNNGYLGLLPLHINGSLILANGEYYGVWFTEELKLARDNGYEVQVIKGYNFNKQYNVFNKFVDDLYDIKCNSKGSIKSITKLILNSPFGRLGMSINKPITDIVNKEKLDLIVSTRETRSIKELNHDQYIVTYNPEISKSVCEKNGLDYIKVLNKNKMDIENINRFSDVSIATAAAITSYARIYMNKIKLLILSLGGKIYYMDTDSIVTDIELPKNLIGGKLGQFKLEYKIKKGYFISSKTYCLVLDDGSEVIKSKGVYNDSLNSTDFMCMYYNKKDIRALKGDTKTNYEKGYVSIGVKEITLNHDAYTKRQKIYNNDGLWVDTRPLVIVDKEFICKSTDFVLVDYNSAYYNLDLINYIFPPRNKNLKLLPSPATLLCLPSPAILLCLPCPPTLLCLPKISTPWLVPIIPIPVTTISSLEVINLTGFLSILDKDKDYLEYLVPIIPIPDYYTTECSLINITGSLSILDLSYKEYLVLIVPNPDDYTTECSLINLTGYLSIMDPRKENLVPIVPIPDTSPSIK